MMNIPHAPESPRRAPLDSAHEGAGSVPRSQSMVDEGAEGKLRAHWFGREGCHLGPAHHLLGAMQGVLGGPTLPPPKGGWNSQDPPPPHEAM